MILAMRITTTILLKSVLDFVKEKRYAIHCWLMGKLSHLKNIIPRVTINNELNRGLRIKSFQGSYYQIPNHFYGMRLKFWYSFKYPRKYDVKVKFYEIFQKILLINMCSF